jgi:hypothetical protein
LAEFLKSAEAAKDLSLQREKDRAHKRISAGSINSVEIPQSTPGAGRPDSDSPPPPPAIQEQELADQLTQDYGEF